MYKCEHFKLQELLPQELMEALVDVHDDVLWGVFDENLLRGLDWMKGLFPRGTITINDWEWGGEYSQSGLRTKRSKYYSSTSMHSIGKASDLKFSAYSMGEVLNKLRLVEDSPYIRRIENGTDGWIHVDVLETGKKGLYFFNA